MKTASIIAMAAGVICVLMFSGCASTGAFTAANVTDVQLQKSNYKIVATGVSGTAQAGYIFGGSMSMGMATTTFAVARVSGSGMLYKEALESLWKNYESKYGAVEGKRLALVNVRYDADVLNMVVYTQPTVTVRADVIEFTE